MIVIGSTNNEDAVLAAKKTDGWIEIFVFLAVLGKSKAAQLIDDLHPGDVSGESIFIKRRRIRRSFFDN